ncbi:DCC1-like thiol-disulfide oxidoreductase family protein [Inquilinus sp. CAU 1745]|uniref:DCC1-like thiol-disulfide oxidoreductase family protein n=1 Tax=Inquilinus sp. CAU 1745 TaxID=3140369 RepID=UPI00325BCBE2
MKPIRKAAVGGIGQSSLYPRSRPIFGRMSGDPPKAAWLVYDGACPFCTAYARYVRVRRSVGVLELVDARKGGPLVEEVREAGLDLDQGMVLKMGGRLYHGADCLNVLAMLGSRSGLFNRLNAAIFRSPALSRALYPSLRAGRNLTLSLIGRRRLTGRR